MYVVILLKFIKKIVLVCFCFDSSCTDSFIGKSVVLNLCKGPDRGWKREEKYHHVMGLEPRTSLSRGMCSTAVLQTQPQRTLLVF